MKKNIKVIFTGGTISMSKPDDEIGVNITNSHMPFETDLVNQFPQYNITFETFSMVPSPYLEIKDMFALIKRIDEITSNDDSDAVIVSHGTDVLEESAFMADLYLDTKKPVIFTGSMRNYSEVSYDGLRNLMTSIMVAADSSSENQGVLIVLNDEINSAVEATKTHTLSLGTFKSLEFGPLGIIDDQRVIYYRKMANVVEHIRPDKIDKKVEIFKVSAGSSLDILNLLIDKNYDGIIIEALGRGNVPPKIVPGIKRAIENNISVVLTSRAPMGRVLGTYGYDGGGAKLEKMGVIFAPNINSQKARIKLILALSRKVESINSLKKLFQTH